MNEPRECKWCDRGWAVIGIVLGGAIVLIGIDLLTGGALSRRVPGSQAAEETGDDG